MTRRQDAPYRRTYPDGRTVWIARYRHPLTGRREYAHPVWNRRKATFELKRDAQRAINEAIEHALSPEARSDTVQGYARTWLEHHPRGERTNKTHEHRLTRLMDVEVEGKPLGHYKLTELTLRHANILYDHLLREGRALRGAKGILATFSAMLEDAIRDDLAATNPFRQVRTRKNDPRIQKRAREPQLWTFQEMHYFATHALTHGLEGRALVRVLSDCGLRLGEALALRSDGFTGSTLEVRATAHEGKIIELEGDTKKHRRNVPVPAELSQLLAFMLEQRDESWLMFPTARGKVWRESNFYRDFWQPVRDLSGLPIAPHDMRHSYLTQCAAAGIDLADLAEVAGHNVQTLINTYTHPLGRSDDRIREAVR